MANAVSSKSIARFIEPFRVTPGAKVTLSRNKVHASVKRGSNGLAAKITTKGNPVLVVTDSSGNTSCTVVQIPKDE